MGRAEAPSKRRRTFGFLRWSATTMVRTMVTLEEGTGGSGVTCECTPRERWARKKIKCKITVSVDTKALTRP